MGVGIPYDYVTFPAVLPILSRNSGRVPHIARFPRMICRQNICDLPPFAQRRRKGWRHRLKLHLLHLELESTHPHFRQATGINSGLKQEWDELDQRIEQLNAELQRIAQQDDACHRG